MDSTHRHFVFTHERAGCAKSFNNLAHSPRAKLRGGEGGLDFRVLGDEAGGFAEMVERVGGAAFHLKGEGEVVVGAGEVGHEADDLLELRDGVVGRAGFGEAGGEVVAGGDVFEIELEHGAKGFVGIRLFADAVERSTELIPNGRLVGRDAERGLVVGDGGGVFAELAGMVAAAAGFAAELGAGEAGVGVGAGVV